MSAAGAAFVNGTAAHGEDFDDTFEGGPVHAGAVVVPAVLAACERYRLHGQAALLGIAVGVETVCRLGLVAPKAVHKAGFHPTAIFGAMAAAAGVGGGAASLSRARWSTRSASSARMASGIIEYLAEGAWTKRLHPGWAAQSGIRAALLGREGFVGPAHRARGRARAVSRLRPHHQGRLRRADRRFRRALGDRDARLQALSVRHHDPSLYRLRAAAGGARHQGRMRSRRWSARWRRERCTGCGSRSPPSSIPATAMAPSSPAPIASRPASCAAMSGSTPSRMRRCASPPWWRWPPR